MRVPVPALAIAAAIALAPTWALAEAPRAEPPRAEPPRAVPPAAAPAPPPAAKEPLPLLTDDELPAGEPLPPAPMVERHMRQPERLTARPSGFWTPNRPAVGGSYRYGKLVIGVVVAALMGLFTVRLVRKHARRTA